MLRISLILLIIFICSCSDKHDDKSNHLVLEFSDKTFINQNVPVYINGKRYTYLAQENFKDDFVSLYIPDSIKIESLSGFELRRLDYFGSIGLYIYEMDSITTNIKNDTIKITSILDFDSISDSRIDTAQVHQITKSIQKVGQHFNDEIE